jgi:DNA-binding response OmpR family regulator
MRIACLMPDDAVYATACRNLAPHGFECSRHTDDASLLRVIHRGQIDIVLCDVGFDSAMEERLLTWLEGSHTPPLPIVLQTPDLRAARVARALSAGADDVVPRSADIVEMVARLRASIRRRRRHGGGTRLDIGGYHLDQTTGRVMNEGVSIELTVREFALAWLLFSNAGTCLSRKTISVVVWGLDEALSSRSMEQHIHSLRRKLRLHDARGVTIRAIYGKGYQVIVGSHGFKEVPGRIAPVHLSVVAATHGAPAPQAAPHPMAYQREGIDVPRPLALQSSARWA